MTRALFLPIVAAVLLILTLLFQLSIGKAETHPPFLPEFLPCDPVSEWLSPNTLTEPSPQFCQQWNPDFSLNGFKCCGKGRPTSRGVKRRGKGAACRKGINSYCSDMTSEQKEYIEGVQRGKLGNILALLTREMGKKGDQAFCTVNNGFLVRGRPIVPTLENRIVLKSPDRCLNYGTDAMAAMVEWLSQEVNKSFSKEEKPHVRLILGDISGPKGGCLVGRSGRKGHASHTTGQDADIGFLASDRGEHSLNRFTRDFEPARNWWFLKKIFKNPYACIKVIFLDRKHIRSLSKTASKDEDWNMYKRFIRHMPSHKNHFHVRIGNGPGLPGCVPGARPELEVEYDFDETEEPNDSEILDELKASQGSYVQ